MVTHWVCRKIDAESCDNVETVAQRGIVMKRCQNYDTKGNEESKSFVHFLSISPRFTHCRLLSFKQCWALPQIGPLIRNLRIQSFGLRICKPISHRKHLRICSKKIETYRKSANQQDCFFAISPKILFTIQCIDRFGQMYL